MSRRPLFLLTLSALVLGLSGCPEFTAEPEELESGQGGFGRPSSTIQAVAPPPAEAPPAPAPTPAPAPPPTPAAGDDGPTQIRARHVLVQYQGSTRAGADITRTKEEARERAMDIARQAKRPDADFAAIAEEMSDGPSAPRGGDLGSFRREQMVPPFSEAAFALEVGAVSDVVETGFGFHVIQRYQ
ncbi:MAG: peptidylprolyl isomerase [Myxococcota bacterium]